MRFRVHNLPEQENARLHRDRVGGLCTPAVSTSKTFLLPGPTWLRVHIVLQLITEVKQGSEPRAWAQAASLPQEESSPDDEGDHQACSAQHSKALAKEHGNGVKRERRG